MQKSFEALAQIAYTDYVLKVQELPQQIYGNQILFQSLLFNYGYFVFRYVLSGSVQMRIYAKCKPAKDEQTCRFKLYFETHAQSCQIKINQQQLD